jgi:hypothetical protein
MLSAVLRPSTRAQGVPKAIEGRGKEVSRIEGFSDAVFGFTLTLLVVSVDVPASFGDLRNILIGFPAFAVTFAVICWVWYEHHLFFRRYDLEDGLTVFANCVLLFVVVFYAYPLKFVFTRLSTGTMLGFGPGIMDGMTQSDGRLLMFVYSSGFMLLFGTFVALHWNAWRQRERLRLDTLELFDARAGIRRHAISAAFGLASLVIVIVAPGYGAFAGLIFFLLGPAHGTFGYINGRRRNRLEASLCPPSGTLQPEPTSVSASAV